MKTKAEQILTVIYVLSWITFVGLMIKTGAFVTSYVVTMINSDAAKNLYPGLDLTHVRNFGRWHYESIAIFLIVLSGLKAYIAYLVIQVSEKLNVSKPFHDNMVVLIGRISHTALEAGVVALVAEMYTDWLMKRGIEVEQNWSGGELLFLAGVIFVIAQVFKKGVELQSENELTI